MANKYVVPSDKTELLQDFARNVAAIGAGLKPSVDKCLVNYPSERVKAMFGRIPSLLNLCIDAPDKLNERLRLLSDTVTPGAMERAQNHLKGEAARITKKWVESRANQRIEDIGQVQYEASAAAFKNSTVSAKGREQKHIAVEAALGVISAYFHHIAVPLELLNIVRQFVPSLKNNQTKKEIEKLAQQTYALDEFEDRLINICLFLYLIPEEVDLKNGTTVNHTLARERLEADL